MQTNQPPTQKSAEMRNPNPTPTLQFTVLMDLLPRFLRLLESGFFVKAPVGLSIKKLLCQHLGIPENYLAERIQTLFLDGKPVDDVENAHIQPDATLALSGAMPGLVGATFRKGGSLALMRKTISYHEEASTSGHGEARVKIKLFNMVLKDLGPVFLEKGVWIELVPFQEFLSRNLKTLKKMCTCLYLNDRKIEISDLAAMKWKQAELFLQVKTERASEE
jgi:hypothetical protein